MSSTLTVKVTKRKLNGAELWEGTVSPQGIRPTKLTKSKSKETAFLTATAVKKAAEKFATSHGYAGVKFNEPLVGSTPKTPARKTRSQTTAKKCESSCSSTPTTM